MDAQLFDVNGVARTQPFQVNTFSNGSQEYATVAMAPAGNFVVTWSSKGEADSGWAVYAQRYDAHGNPLGREFQVAANPSGNDEYSTVAMNANGFVVTWSSFGQLGNGLGIFGQRYDANGNALGGPFQVNTTSGYATDSTVAMNVTGEFVVTWSLGLAHGAPANIFGQRFDTQGNRLGGEFQVGLSSVSNQQDPSVAIDAGGSFVVAWQAQVQNSWEIEAQRYDSSGNPLGSPFQVNNSATGNFIDPAVAMNENGDFMITWASNAQTNDPVMKPSFIGQNLSAAALLGMSYVTLGQGPYNIYERQFDGEAGCPQGAEFQLNLSTTGDHQYVSLAMNDEGHIVAVWSGPGSNGANVVEVLRMAVGADNLEGDSGDGAASTESGSSAPAGSDAGLVPAAAPLGIGQWPRNGGDLIEAPAAVLAAPSATGFAAHSPGSFPAARAVTPAYPPLLSGPLAHALGEPAAENEPGDSWNGQPTNDGPVQERESDGPATPTVRPSELSQPSPDAVADGASLVDAYFAGPCEVPPPAGPAGNAAVPLPHTHGVALEAAAVVLGLPLAWGSSHRTPSEHRAPRQRPVLLGTAS